MIQDSVTIHKINNVYVRLETDRGVLREISEHFSFKIPNFKFHPKVKSGMWDGTIRLLNVNNGTMYIGLWKYLLEFCQQRNIAVIGAEQFDPDDFDHDIEQFIENLKLPYVPHDYQSFAVKHAINNRMATLLAATSAGKSLVSYILARYMVAAGGKVLVIVPSVTLVNQLRSDFEEYSQNNSWDVEANTHLITAGVEKSTTKPVTISTWKSIYTLKKRKLTDRFMNQYQMVIVDECHGAAASELVAILEAATNVPYRVGMTGTLQDAKAHEWVIEGLLGPQIRIIRAIELMEQKKAAQIKIRAVVLEHPTEDRRLVKSLDYKKEVGWICQNNNRNKFIAKMADSIKGNTLILYRFIDGHGDLLMSALQQHSSKKVFHINGDTSGVERERIRKAMELEEDVVLVASIGVLAVGTSIKNIRNLILAHPSKAKIKTLQSIGRAMRLAAGKTSANVFDIADNLIIGKHINTTMKHFQERIKMYASEQFDYQIIKHPIKP